jgi:glyoxylase-like metal-dependent hydrolase (beta-lactamase superfamily II)
VVSRRGDQASFPAGAYGGQMTAPSSLSPDSYGGHVEPKGAPAHRKLGDLSITKFSVGPMDNNAYLLVCRQTGDAVLIDAANDAQRILEVVQQSAAGTKLGSIITTHSHYDHWQALAEVVEASGATVLAGKADASGLPIPVDVELETGDSVDLGDCRLELIGLRGHTAGSVAVLYRDPAGGAHLFTGDSLFPGGPGKTKTPEDFNSLMDDLEARIFAALPDDTWVYPGHGDDTTLGAERPHLSEWRERGW